MLLDLLMPDPDGYALLRDFKSDPETRDIPVLVISVVDAADSPAAADARLSKPVKKDDLLRALDTLTGSPKVQA